MKILRDLFAQFKAYHDHGRPFVQYTGMVGIFAFPLFYLLRFTKVEPPYNDLWLRGLASLICLGLALKNHWPERAKPYFMVYAYAALLFCLPFFFMFTSLANGGGVVAVANTLMAVFFLILLSDWRNTIVMLLTATVAAYAMFRIVLPGAELPMDYVARLPIAVLVVIGGSLFKFAEKRAEADRLRHIYTALAGSIAHEMRNPLSQLASALDNIERTLPPPTTLATQPLAATRLDALYGHLSAGQLAVQRGLQVIALTLGEVRSRSFDPAGFTLVSAGETTLRAVEEYSFDPPTQRERVQVRVVNDFTFQGDETIYLFIVFNLLRNAVYYFEAYPHARVLITVDGGLVAVRDTGPGMSEEALAQLFQPFSTSGKSEGTGLGLSYCRRAMQAFGGDIGCRSAAGVFTEFTLSFPVVPAEQVEAEHEARLAQASVGLAGRRILVVDDDARLRQSASRMLRQLGCVVTEADGGEWALDLLQGIECDAVLLDLMMPGLDGYGVALRLREGAVPDCAHLPIVALTSEPAHIAQPKTRRVGMNGFVSKPATPLTLATALREALQAASPDLGALRGRTVLLAEDGVYSRVVLRSHLQNWGLAVIEAVSGEAVLDHLRVAAHGGPPIDLVLMDLGMPGMGGLAATRAVRALGGPMAGLPIIALTGHAQDEMGEEATLAGVSDYLVKPVQPPALLRALQRHLGPARMDTGADSGARHSVFAHGLMPPPPKPGAAVAAPRAPAPPPEPPSAADGPPLLDRARLAQLRQVDMIDSLPLYLAQMHDQLARLAAARERGDLHEAKDALHSVLGASGDSGAVALHRAARGYYAAFAEQRWPAEPEWVATLVELARATDAAMHAQYIQASR